MKKILSILAICVMAVSASAENVFKILDVPTLDIDRPYFNLSYSEIHGLTADKADKDAFFEGALRYYYGYSKRLEIPFPKDYGAAAIWFYEAGKLDHGLAAYFLGNMYLTSQGVKYNVQDAFWWLEKARSLGIKQASHKLANLYYESYQLPNVPETYKMVYLTTTNKYLDELVADDYAYAKYNKALIMLRTLDMTRFVKRDANQLLLESVYGFAELKDRVSAYEALKVMQYYKLDSYTQAETLFNDTFKG